MIHSLLQPEDMVKITAFALTQPPGQNCHLIEGGQNKKALLKTKQGQTILKKRGRRSR
jgi:hypothetical protein